VTERLTVTNAALADQLETLAGLGDLLEANRFAVRAYRRAAEVIRAAPVSVADLVRTGRAEELSGIGPGIEARLRELVETGELRELTELEQRLRPDLLVLTHHLGLPTARVLEIAERLGVSTADDLRQAAEAGKLRTVPGIGEKTEARLLARLRGDVPKRGLPLSRARDLCAHVATRLEGTVAGDVRRFRDLCESLAVVVPTERPADVLDEFEGLPQVLAVIERGRDRASAATVEGNAIDLVTTPPGMYGTRLLEATGAQAYVAPLQPLPLASSEPEVYAALGIPVCPPELRERPYRGTPPALLQLGDVRGDLHVHTVWSDGRDSVLEMARAALALGYEYLAICDHTPSVGVVRGLTADDIRRQGEEIQAANELVAPLHVLRGVECDIRRDGSLDLPDDILEELEWVQLSLHAGQRESREQLTARVIEAMRHPAVCCLSHPKGRILNHRPPNALDLERVFEVAVETGVALEINGLPDRLDLSGENARLAIDAGAQLVVSTDAHSSRGLSNMELAVGTARRGWASSADVVNTRPFHLLHTTGRLQPFTDPTAL
jgi:DNA polymerase (family X)